MVPGVTSSSEVVWERRWETPSQVDMEVERQEMRGEEGEEYHGRHEYGNGGGGGGENETGVSRSRSGDDTARVLSSAGPGSVGELSPEQHSVVQRTVSFDSLDTLKEKNCVMGKDVPSEVGVVEEGDGGSRVTDSVQQSRGSVNDVVYQGGKRVPALEKLSRLSESHEQRFNTSRSEEEPLGVQSSRTMYELGKRGSKDLKYHPSPTKNGVSAPCTSRKLFTEGENFEEQINVSSGGIGGTSSVLGGAQRAGMGEQMHGSESHKMPRKTF